MVPEGRLAMKNHLSITLSTYLSFHRPGIILLVLHRILYAFAHIEDDIVKFKLKATNIVPLVIPTMPQHKLSVVYKHAAVKHGNTIDSNAIIDEPAQVTWPARDGFYYTLFMIGPDTPTREQPMDKNWLHWLVTNIKGNDIENGDEIAEYCGSLAGYEAGLHSLIYVVFENPSGRKIKFDEEHIDEDAPYGKRTSFDILKFTQKYGIKTPVAANFAVLDLKFGRPSDQ